MRKQFLTLFCTASLGLTALFCQAQPYSNAVTALSPIAYWPLNETAAPPPEASATNLGSLGSTQNAAFIGDVTFGLPGAIAGDTADGFNDGTGAAQAPYSTAVSTSPSFTVEAWLLTHDTNGGDTRCVLSDFSTTRSGWLLYLNINNGGQYNFRTYDGIDTSASVNLNLGAAGSIAKDAWYHVVVVVSNAVTSTNVYAYINGVQVANAAVGGSGFKPNNGVTGGFSIGERTDGGFLFKGAINDVAYYTTALDANTILAHYTAGTSAPATYAATVQLASPALYYRLDEPNNLPIAHNYGSLGAAANGVYQTGTVPGVAGPSFGAFPNGFGGSDFATQFSPSGTQDNTNPGPGVVCGAGNLAGLDDQTSLTLSAWVKVPTGPVGWFTGVLGRGDSSYRFGLDQGGAPHFADGGGGNGDIVGSGAVNDGNWHQWVGVYNSVSSNASFYIDSQLVGTAQWNPPGGNTETEFYIGGAPDYEGRNFVGSIAQVAVYNKVLTAAQVQTVFSSTAPSPFELAVSDLKPAAYWPLQETTQPPAAVTPVAANLGTVGSGLDGVITGDVIFGAPGALASSSDSADVFSGNAAGGGTSFIQSPYTTDLANNPSFTIEAWLMEDNLGYTQCPLSDFDAGNADTNRLGWLIYQDITAPGLYTFRAYNANGLTPSLSMAVGAAGAISANQWNHLVVVVSNAVTATNVYAYLNGQLVAGPTLLPSYLPNDGFNGGISVGARDDAGFHFAGGIDEVAYYTNALDPNTILAHYQAATNPTPATAYSALVLQSKPIVYYQLDEAPLRQPYPATLPVAVNYGTTGSNANGYYQPTVVPGVPGPTNSGMGSSSLAASFDPSDVQGSGAEGSGPGVICDPYAFNALNPTNGFAMTAWVQVSIGWFETVVGRTDNSYRFDIDTTGLPHFAAAPNSDLVGANVVADGLWHYWEGVYDPGTSVGSLYVDGILVASAPWQAPASLEDFLMLGGAPDYVGRNFSGNLSHVAIFTNALSQAQVEGLYGSIGVVPTILLPTNALYVNDGANGSITAQVSGTGPFNEQWYSTTGSGAPTPVANETTTTLTLTDVTAAQNALQYFLVADNQYGSTTSSVVTLNVVQGPPTIQADVTPPLSYAPVGVDDAFSVVVTGSQPFFYHWYLNGAPITGATSATYPFTVLAGSNIYNAQISNAFGPVTSASATVVGLTGPPPIIGFSSAATEWTTNTNPNGTQQVPELTATSLELTDGTNGEVSSAWYNIPQYVGGFVAKFTYQALPGTPGSLADGATFTIQNSSMGLTAIGGGGGDLGIYGLNNLASFLLDLYNITGGGIQFSTNGETGGGTAPAFSYIATTPLAMEIGDAINVRLFFNQGTMNVLMTDPTAGTTFTDTHVYGDVISIIGGASAYVGFTGSTGGVASTQIVSNFVFSSTTPPIVAVTPAANNSVVISWPVSVSTMFTLEQSDSVTGPWLPLSGSTVVNGQNQLTVSATGSAKFYQLLLQ